MLRCLEALTRSFIPSRRSRKPGQSVVEFGIVVIIFFLLVSGIIDFGRALNAWIVMSNAGREGVRWASVGADLTQITERARAFALVPGVNPADVTVTRTYTDADGNTTTTPSTGDMVTVTVTATTFEIVTPLVRPFFCGNGSGPCYVPISSQTTMRYEGEFIS